jgi:hypothetical protein
MKVKNQLLIGLFVLAIASCNNTTDKTGAAATSGATAIWGYYYNGRR